MSNEGSVTQWIFSLKDGNSNAAGLLWERYWRRLHGLARKQLGNSNRGAVDEEDVAISAFADFCQQVQKDGFKQGLADREDLWQVLALLTKRKAIDQFRKESRFVTEHEPIQGSIDDSQQVGRLDTAVQEDASPSAIVQAKDELARLLSLLPDEQTRRIACLRLEGFGNLEISALEGCALRTVERRVTNIKSLWSQEIGF
ncbi:MAG: ECF-type sigma factor [Planctomycetota bacterium]|jgi:DNA-directed RNA polymerase specialized sigma24 family protein